MPLSVRVVLPVKASSQWKIQRGKQRCDFGDGFVLDYSAQQMVSEYRVADRQAAQVLLRTSSRLWELFDKRAEVASSAVAREALEIWREYGDALYEVAWPALEFCRRLLSLVRTVCPRLGIDPDLHGEPEVWLRDGVQEWRAGWIDDEASSRDRRKQVATRSVRAICEAERDFIVSLHLDGCRSYPPIEFLLRASLEEGPAARVLLIGVALELALKYARGHGKGQKFVRLLNNLRSDPAISQEEHEALEWIRDQRNSVAHSSLHQPDEEELEGKEEVARRVLAKLYERVPGREFLADSFRELPSRPVSKATPAWREYTDDRPLWFQELSPAWSLAGELEKRLPDGFIVQHLFTCDDGEWEVEVGRRLPPEGGRAPRPDAPATASGEPGTAIEAIMRMMPGFERSSYHSGQSVELEDPARREALIEEIVEKARSASGRRGLAFGVFRRACAALAAIVRHWSNAMPRRRPRG